MHLTKQEMTFLHKGGCVFTKYRVRILNKSHRNGCRASSRNADEKVYYKNEGEMNHKAKVSKCVHNTLNTHIIIELEGISYTGLTSSNHVLVCL